MVNSDMIERWNEIWKQIRRPDRFPDGSKTGRWKQEDRKVAALLLIAEILQGDRAPPVIKMDDEEMSE